MSDAIVATAVSLFTTFAEGDRERMEALLAPDFHFTSPHDNRIDRDAYFERCWPGHTQAAGFDIIRTARDGDTVFVSYAARWESGSGGRNTEIITIRGGQVVEVEVFFGWDLPHQQAPGQSVTP